MRVVVAPQARRETAAHIGYIAARNRAAAIRQRTRISDAIAGLQQNPFMGRPGRVADTRELAIGGTPLLIVYSAGPDEVAILHVLHGRQAWPPEDELLGS